MERWMRVRKRTASRDRRQTFIGHVCINTTVPPCRSVGMLGKNYSNLPAQHRPGCSAMCSQNTGKHTKHYRMSANGESRWLRSVKITLDQNAAALQAWGINCGFKAVLSFSSLLLGHIIHENNSKGIIITQVQCFRFQRTLVSQWRDLH